MLRPGAHFSSLHQTSAADGACQGLARSGSVLRTLRTAGWADCHTLLPYSMATVAGVLLIAVSGCGEGKLLASTVPDLWQDRRTTDTGGTGFDQGQADAAHRGADAGLDAAPFLFF